MSTSTNAASNLLSVTELGGSPRDCGAAYGEAFETRILGFCRQELKPDKKRLLYARRCWPHVERSAPDSAAFMRGMAEGAHLSLDHVALLALHEEVYHQQHCTAFAATRRATRGRKTILGQNWDWAPSLYPWPGLLRLRIKGSPQRITYHYPGLWSCAGINEEGLCLVWTGGGYYPTVRPVVGVPTYVLVAEILARATVADALDFLRDVKQAGSFIFFLGDASGDTAVVEAVPGHIQVDRGADLMTRANHYCSPKIIDCAAQVTPARNGSTTLQRAARMAALVEQNRGKLTESAAKRILTDREGDWPWLHAFPGGRKAAHLEGMTIDSLLAVCEDRALWTCRGGRVPGPWQCVTV